MSYVRHECVYDVRVAEIALVNSKRVALIDDADLPLVRGYRWYLRKDKWNAYAYGYLRGRPQIFMHRLLLAAPRGMPVDHKNGDGLDNRRKNIRICTHSQNSLNRKAERNSATGLKGVVFRPNARSPNKYEAQGRLLGEFFYLGTYSTALAAHRAYCSWAAEAHGSFFRAS